MKSIKTIFACLTAVMVIAISGAATIILNANTFNTSPAANTQQQRKSPPASKVVPVPADWIAIEDKEIGYSFEVPKETKHTVEKAEVIDELWGSFSILASEAHISEVTLGKDKKISEPTEDFGPNETIFAAVEISENKKTVKVKGRLHVVEIEGQKAGPIPGIEAIVILTGAGTANFQFSKPTKGWPLGKYKFEALLINENGETIDTESHEFTVE